MGIAPFGLQGLASFLPSVLSHFTYSRPPPHLYSLKQPFSLFFKQIGLLPASVSLLASEVPSVSYEGVFLMLFPLPGFCLLIQVFTKVSLAQRTLRELLPSLLSCSTSPLGHFLQHVCQYPPRSHIHLLSFSQIVAPTKAQISVCIFLSQSL